MDAIFEIILRSPLSEQTGSEIVQASPPRQPLVRRPLRFEEYRLDSRLLQCVVGIAEACALFGARAQPEKLDFLVERRRIGEGAVVCRLAGP
jgi:hypothetical protein